MKTTRNFLSRGLVCSSLTALFLLGGVFVAQSQTGTAQPEVRTDSIVFPAEQHDTSLPLRELALLPHARSRSLEEAPRAIPWLRTGPPGIASEPPPPIQRSTEYLQPVSTANLVTFTSIPADGWVPPDPNASVGATQIVEVVNTVLQVFSKTGTSILGPEEIGTLWSGFGGVCDPASASYYTDPVVVYDKAAGRWVVTILAAANNTAPSTECIAVSVTSDATGSYYRYSFAYGYFGDYPKIGVWSDAYYVSYNLFSGGNYVAPLVCGLNRTAMLAGTTATNMAVCFQLGGGGSLLPSDLDGSTPPSSGEPGFFMELSGNYSLYKFHVDFTTPGNSTFTGPVSLNIGSYGEACGGNNACIPQSGTTQELDSLGDRLMHRLAYRNFGSYDMLASNSAVQVGSNIGITWFEIYDPNSSTPYAYDAGTYLPDSNDRWMGSIAMDKFGNLALGYSVSSSSLYPSIRFTGKGPGDSKNIMEAETTLFAGQGSQLPNPNCSKCDPRWGDYTSMAIDPTDDCTFVYTNEYYTGNSSSDAWATGIAVFRLLENFSLVAVPCSNTVTAGKSLNYTVEVVPSNGIYNNLAFSASGLPSGATATFNPTSLTGTGLTTMAISTTTSTPPGTYTVTVTANSGNGTQSTTTVLKVASSGTPGTGSVAISGSEKWTCPPSCTHCARSCVQYDVGSVTITVNGHSDTVGYGAQNGFEVTAASIAAALADAINSDCAAFVTATSSLVLTARQNGTASNYTLSTKCSTSGKSTCDFTATPSGSTLTGGTN